MNMSYEGLKMTIDENSAALSHGTKTTIEIAGTDLVFRSVKLDADNPTGSQIAKAAGFKMDQHPYIYQWRQDGDLEDIRPNENADLHNGSRFIVAESDRTHRITVDDEQFDWPAPVISGGVLRKLGKVSPDKAIFFERQDEPDRLVGDNDLVNLDAEGVEEFKSGKPPTWKLKVQDVQVEFDVPIVTVTEALTKAGFATTGWIIILKVAGQPKRQLAITDAVDLSTPGIEKIRLTPNEINNGEARPAPRRDFSLLDTDEAHLDRLGLVWETDESTGKRYLFIHGYPVPSGYTISSTTLALLIPPTYPHAQIDMFYVHPPLVKSTGAVIPATQSKATIRGLQFQRWSRHRGTCSQWNPRTDNVITHLALVESAIAKEVGA